MSFCCAVLVTFAVVLHSWAWGGVPADLPPGMYAEITTERGTLWAELFFERTPLTVANFVGLAEGKLGPKLGTPFYNGLTFHRVVPDFVVQGGDPLGTGEGGPGYVIPDEFDPLLSHDRAGVLSMANEGPDTNGSQFFITLAAIRRLDFLHSVFGRVIRGTEVARHIEQGDRMTIAIHRLGERAQTFPTDAEAVQRFAASKPKFDAEGKPPFFEDANGLLPSDPPRARYFHYRLANVARATGQRIYARIERGAGLTEAARDVRTQEIATTLGLGERGVLAIYFTDANAWSFWVGRDDAKRVARSGVSHQEQEHTWLAAAGKATEDWIVQAEKAGKPLDVKQRLKLTIDGVLNELIDVFVTTAAASTQGITTRSE